MTRLSRNQVLSILNAPLTTASAVSVVDHTDPTLQGISGNIENETRYMLHIRSFDDGRLVAVSKVPGKFYLETPQGSCTVDGYLLEGDAKRRAKRKLRHW